MKRVLLTNSLEIMLVSDVDYPAVRKHRWYLLEGYPHTGKPNISITHFILGFPPKGKEWDHKDENKLNNQRRNLRSVTHAQNMWNRGRTRSNKSGFKGVSWLSSRKKWQAQIRIKGVVKNLGNFDDPIEAAQVYDSAVIKTRGEFGSLNFPMRFPRLREIVRYIKH